METSIFIAQLLAVVYLTCSIGFLFNRKEYEDMVGAFEKSSVATIFAGLLALVVGFLIVHSHNHWEASWRVVITVFGWVGLLKGVILVAAPAFARKMIVFKTKMLRFGWTMSLALGLYFGYFGFIASAT